MKSGQRHESTPKTNTLRQYGIVYCYPKLFYAIDLEAISCLVTFEQTLILCQNNDIDSQIDEISITDTESSEHNSKQLSAKPLGTFTPDMPSVPKSERIKTNKYCYDIIRLLAKSQQAVIHFSTLFQELRSANREEDSHSTSFSDLSEQLVFISETKRSKDIYIDKSYKCHKSDDLSHAFKPLKTSDIEAETHPKNSLKQFCQTLETIYGNCMTQALYKSLEFGYFIDKRDTIRIAGNICTKIVLNIDISKCLISLCEDLKHYLGYFGCHEMMLQILQDRANDTQTQITEAVTTAAIDCRRDLLWSCLLPRVAHNSDSEDFSLTIAQFDELLGLVDTISLSQYDKRLMPFTGLQMSWYQSLAKTLVHKIGMNYRDFSSPDMKSIKLEICLVFKKQMTNKSSELFMESYTQCHTLVEEFINGCAYYMWSSIPALNPTNNQ
ncbi:unnamed protein product [Medioppia subpectinata]|uniref:Uncharacterized protein n=1 Tax=Medioppia subpectinata TaxID=1979941 RepID=A0A7R9KZ60_9ACAR|nr:unnamed protein product [Medioppia subpectinata]CAG2111316.1 unnamed protein product [Medioppia subpectinata]